MKDIINFWHTDVGIKNHKYLRSIIEDNFPNEGKYTRELENKVEKLLNVKHCIATPNCTLALFMCLKVLGIGHKDEVIIPNLTFPATANAALMTGAKVVLADINSETLNIDTYNLSKKITKKTKAIIPVHVSGRHCEVDIINKIAKRNGIYVIEDAAEAFFSLYKKKYLGTFGDLGCFSLSPNKIITSGQGGLIVTNNNTLSKKLRLYKNQGRFGLPSGGDDDYISTGGNFKLSNISSGLALSEIKSLKKRSKRLKKNYELYRKYLHNVKQIKLFPFKTDKNEIPLWTDALCENRDELFNYLKSMNIHCRKFWKPLSDCKIYSKQKIGHFKISNNYKNKLLWLPSSFLLNDKDIIKVSKTIISFYN